MQRVFAFLDPFSDPRGSGYQIIQSLTAVGSGGALGLGIGASVQKLFFLPASHTDFVFSVICEELGFVGGVLIVLVYLSLAFFGALIAYTHWREIFSYLVAQMMWIIIVVEAFLNIGVVLGLLPTKGLPLPFLSYGGSNLITSFMATGILLSLSKGGGNRYS